MSKPRRKDEVPDDWFFTSDFSDSNTLKETRPLPTRSQSLQSWQRCVAGIGACTSPIRPNERTRLFWLVGLLFLLPLGYAYLRDMFFVVNPLSGYVDPTTLLPEIFSSFLATLYGLIAGSLFLNSWKVRERMVLIAGAVGSLMMWRFYVAPSDDQHWLGSTSKVLLAVLCAVGVISLFVTAGRSWLDRASQLLRADRHRHHRQFLVAAAIMLVSLSLVRYKIGQGGFGLFGGMELSWPWLVIPLTIFNLVPGMILMRGHESVMLRIIWSIVLIFWWGALYVWLSAENQLELMYLLFVPLGFALGWLLGIGILFSGSRIGCRPLGRDYGWALAALWSLPIWLVLVGGLWIHHQYDARYLIRHGLDWETAKELRQWSRFSEVDYSSSNLLVKFRKGFPQSAIEFSPDTRLVATNLILVGVKQELDLEKFPFPIANRFSIVNSQITMEQLAAIKSRILSLQSVSLEGAEPDPATPRLEFTSLYLFDNADIDLTRLLSQHRDVSKIFLIEAHIRGLSRKNLETLLNLPNVNVHLKGTQEQFACIWNDRGELDSCWLKGTNPAVLLSVTDSQFPLDSSGKAWLTFGLWTKASVFFDSTAFSSLPDLNQPAMREIVMDTFFLEKKLTGHWFGSHHAPEVQDKDAVVKSSHWLYFDDDPSSASYLYLPDINFAELFDQELRTNLQALSLRSDWNLLSPGETYDRPDAAKIRRWICQGPFPQLKELYLPEIRGLQMELIGEDSSFFVDHFPNLEVVDFDASLFWDYSQFQPAFVNQLFDQLVQLKRLRRVVVRNPQRSAIWKVMAASLPTIEEVWMVSDNFNETDLNMIQNMFPNSRVRSFQPDSVDLIPEHYRRHFTRTIEKLKHKYSLPLADPPKN